MERTKILGWTVSGSKQCLNKTGFRSVIQLPLLNLFKIKTYVEIFIPPFPGSSDGKASARNAGDPGSIPGLGRSSGEENGNLLQYSCLENSMDGGAW